MNAPLSARDHYLAEHGRIEARLPGQQSAGFRGLRKLALERFAASGFPTPAQEIWKYTDLKPLEKNLFSANRAPAASGHGIIDMQSPAGLDAHRLVFVDGHFAPACSAIGALPDGVTLAPLSRVLSERPDRIETRLGTTAADVPPALTDLNTAFLTDGLYLDLADGAALDRPVYVHYFSSGSGMSSLRNLIRLGANSEAMVIEHYAGSTDAVYLTNAVTEVLTAADARLARCRLQQESLAGLHLGSTSVSQSRGSQVRLHSVDLGGRIARHDSTVRLDGEHAEVDIQGVYAPTGRQHIDNHTSVDHLRPHGRSREVFKGVLDGHGRGVFNGRIVVHKGAQKTDSAQSSAALLLSKTAEVDAKPELEIYADDVKCSHGATVGQLDEDAVFYLRSRGVDETGARNILTYSFADEVIREVGIEALRKHIETHFVAKLPQGILLRELL